MVDYSPCGRLNANHPQSWVMQTHPNTRINITLVRYQLLQSWVGCRVEHTMLHCHNDPILKGNRINCGSKDRWSQGCHSNKVSITYSGYHSGYDLLGYNISSLRHGRNINLYYEVFDNSRAVATITKVIFTSNVNNDGTYPVKDLQFRSTFVGTQVIESTFVALAPYAWSFTLNLDTKCAGVESRDGPLRYSPLLKDTSHRAGVQTFASTAHIIVLHISVQHLKCTPGQPYISVIYGLKSLDYETTAYEKVAHNKQELKVTNYEHGGRHFFMDSLYLSNALEQNTYIKITVTKLLRSGYPTKTCQYWGLMIYETHRYQANLIGVEQKTPDALSPLFLLCTSVITVERVTETPIPSQFISSASHITLLWYSYDSARFPFEVSLLIEPTLCSGAFTSCVASPHETMPWIRVNRRYGQGYVYGRIPLIPSITQTFTRSKISRFCLNSSKRIVYYMDRYIIWIAFVPGGRTLEVANLIVGYQGVTCLAVQQLPIYPTRNVSCAMECAILLHELSSTSELVTERSAQCLDSGRGFLFPNRSSNPSCSLLLHGT